MPVADVPAEPGLRPLPPRRTRPPKGPTNDQQLIDLIMRLHGSGSSLDSIAAVLNQSGARTDNGRRWHSRTVAAVVAQAAYPQLRKDA